MKSYRDAYSFNLLNHAKLEVHDEFSQLPSFSQSLATQEEHANVLPIPSQSSSDGMQKRARTRNFTSQEDLMLISAWLNVSMNPIPRNDQKRQTYWERVHAYFHENRQFTSDRSPNSLMHRWSVIQLAVNKFQGYFNEIDATNQNGVTEQDKLCQALEMYTSLQKTSFTFVHCWNELRYAPKFFSTSSRKRLKNSEGGSQSPTLSSPTTNSMDIEDGTNILGAEHVLECPTGNEAVKEYAIEGKGNEVDTENDLRQILLEIRELQREQRDDRKALAEEFLKIEKEREERKKRKEDREQILFEQKVLATDTSKMDQAEVQYYTTLKAAILKKRCNSGFNM